MQSIVIFHVLRNEDLQSINNAYRESLLDTGAVLYIFENSETQIIFLPFFFFSFFFFFF